jgi:hypothetical protein
MSPPKLITNHQSLITNICSPANFLFDYLPLDKENQLSEQELAPKQIVNNQSLGGEQQKENPKQKPQQNQEQEKEQEKDFDDFETGYDDLEPKQDEESSFDPPQQTTLSTSTKQNNEPRYFYIPPQNPQKLLYEIHNNTITRNFDSWYDFVTCVNDKSLRGYKNLYNSHLISPERTEFTATKDFPQAVHMALISGWPEGRKLMQDAIAIIAPRPEPYKSISYEVAGAYPLVPLFLTGEPGYMMNFENETTNTNPIIKIDYSFSINGIISPKTIMLRGAAVLSLCNALENRGYSVELRLTDISTDRGLTLKVNIVYKRAGENLDLDRAAFALAHPSTLRRFSFALTEQHKELEQAFGSGYGKALYQPNETNDDIIFIPPPITNHHTPTEHQTEVNKAAEKYLTNTNH